MWGTAVGVLVRERRGAVRRPAVHSEAVLLSSKAGSPTAHCSESGDCTCVAVSVWHERGDARPRCSDVRECVLRVDSDRDDDDADDDRELRDAVVSSEPDADEHDDADDDDADDDDDDVEVADDDSDDDEETDDDDDDDGR